MVLNNSGSKRLHLVFLLMCMSAFLILSGCKKKASQNQGQPVVSAAAKEVPLISKSLEDVISSRAGWNPMLKSFYGKQMPNFEITDINGKPHSLSDYRGKNVLVVIWATWCMPCLDEVPHLVTLRQIMGEEKLAILAISNESADTVRATAERKKMNYTVASHSKALPVPFSSARFVPSAFFVNPDGTLKIATEGSIHLGQMKAIILAE